MTAQAELPWGEAVAATAPCLGKWAPQDWAVAPDWQPLLQAFWQSDAGQTLAQRLQARLARGAVVFPPQPLTALALTARRDVRVVILGQDPYHGAGQAEGLAFSVAPDQKCPPSLRNIFKELDREVACGALPAAASGPARSVSLRHWAAQGVLLLNTCLTVEEGQANSHAGYGWEALTQALMQDLATAGPPRVFLLWGAHAQKFVPMLQEAGQGQHQVLCANHPSPLSANRPPVPFLGCGHFALANAFLEGQGARPIAW